MAFIYRHVYYRLDLYSITRFTSGRVASIDIIYGDSTGTIRTKSATRDKTRTFLGLPSNMYNVVYDSGTNVYTFNWKGYCHGPGNYEIVSYIKDKYSSLVFDEKQSRFVNVINTNISMITLEAYASPQIVSAKSIGKMFINTPINIASDIKPGSNSGYEIRYQLYLNGAFLEEKALESSTEFSFTPSKVGKYTIIPYVKDTLSVKSFDAMNSSLLKIPEIKTTLY